MVEDVVTIVMTCQLMSLTLCHVISVLQTPYYWPSQNPSDSDFDYGRQHFNCQFVQLFRNHLECCTIHLLRVCRSVSCEAGVKE